MTPRVRKLMLTVHLTFSVGWLGAVAAFLALAIAGVMSADPQRSRGAYLAMDLTARFVIVPFSFASLLTGLVQALGTEWGVLQHYWVVIKLLMTVLATIVLLVHLQPIGQVASVAAANHLASTSLHAVRLQLVADASAALLVLLVVTALSVYKPRGKTQYARRRQRG